MKLDEPWCWGCEPVEGVAGLLYLAVILWVLVWRLIFVSSWFWTVCWTDPCPVGPQLRQAVELAARAGPLQAGPNPVPRTNQCHLPQVSHKFDFMSFIFVNSMMYYLQRHIAIMKNWENYHQIELPKIVILNFICECPKFDKLNWNLLWETRNKTWK